MKGSGGEHVGEICYCISGNFMEYLFARSVPLAIARDRQAAADTRTHGASQDTMSWPSISIIYSDVS